jgi:hypothetical protein
MGEHGKCQKSNETKARDLHASSIRIFVDVLKAYLQKTSQANDTEFCCPSCKDDNRMNKSKVSPHNLSFAFEILPKISSTLSWYLIAYDSAECQPFSSRNITGDMPWGGNQYALLLLLITGLALRFEDPYWYVSLTGSCWHDY